ncbi:MAG: MFS transporter [Rhodospirillaceae bacterium]|jgi:predicted MFS family arabinose efflux permease|nr:MFS transporter [Rhodospirillaceae bacterium]
MNASVSSGAAPEKRSDAQQWAVIWLVGAGHFTSHFYVMCLPPLLPFMKDDLQVSNAALGFIMTCFFVAVASVQMPVGMLVDRIGARRVLCAGLLILSGAVFLAGFTSSYWALVGLFALAGIGNSVFHPSDYVILSSSVDEHRMGKAFSIHSVCAQSGFLAAPVLMSAIALLYDWRTALIVGGAFGLTVTVLVFLCQGILRDSGERKKKEPGQLRRTWHALMERKVLAHFFYFAMSSAATTAISSFMIVALVAHYGIAETVAASVLFGYLAAAIGGVVLGGIVADKTKRHDLVLVVTLLVAAACIAVVATGIASFWVIVTLMAIAGASKGFLTPSRDIMVRRDAPPALLGAVVAFVTVGFTIGNSSMPTISGWFVDIGSPLTVFWAAAILNLVAIGCVLISGRGVAKSGATESHS